MRFPVCLAILLFLAGPAAGAPPGTGTPIPIVLLRRSDKGTPDGSNGDVLVAANLQRDALARRVANTMADPGGYTQFVLRLDRLARNYLLRDPGLAPERRASLERPAYLFLSDRQGGFPAEGFWLEGPDGVVREMRNTPFVDLVVADGDFNPADHGGLVAIHAHELGHLIMAALAGPPPPRASSGVHFTTVRTDGWLAFVEGWGEHFQPMAVDHRAGGAGTVSPKEPAGRTWYDRFAREQVEGCWICPANLRFLGWQGPGEQRLRDAGVRSNLFIHELTLPPAFTGEGRPPFEARMYRDVMPPPADGPLKIGARALASEGMLATFFYRLASSERLRESYREPAFYAAFLPDEQAADLARLGPGALVSRPENVYLKVFHVLHRSFRWGDWPLVEFVKGYAAAFPDEAAAVYDVFLDVTRGVTVERAAPSHRTDPGYLPRLRERLLSAEAQLDGHLGRPLWLVVPTISLGMGIYRYFPVPSPLTFDLNAADVSDLRSVPGLEASLAASIVRAREARGWFDRVEDVASVPGITPELASRFAAMRDRMQARLDRPPSRGSNPVWMMNWLARLVKGSYYAAAAWQFGRALALAALAYALTVSLVHTALTRRGVAESPRRPRRWRRAVRSFARGIAAAAWPVAASVALYAAGVLPGPANMAVVGAALGLAAAGARRLAGRSPAPADLAALAPVAGSIAAATLIGLLY